MVDGEKRKTKFVGQVEVDKVLRCAAVDQGMIDSSWC